MKPQQSSASPKRSVPRIISLAEDLAIHQDYRTVWTTERTDLPNWERDRHNYVGKRTLLREGGLEIEGISFIIKEEDSGWYEIHGDSGQHARQQGVKEALRVASGFVAMPSQYKAHYEALLRDTGAAAWSYGFCTVGVQLVSALR